MIQSYVPYLYFESYVYYIGLYILFIFSFETGMVLNEQLYYYRVVIA
jgi:hypothetical protein